MAKDTFVQTQAKLSKLEPSLKSLERLREHLKLAEEAVITVQTFCIEQKEKIRKKCQHKYNDGTSALECGMFGCLCSVCGWDDYSI